MTDIAAHLDHGDVVVAEIAASHRGTPRYSHKFSKTKPDLLLLRCLPRTARQRCPKAGTRIPLASVRVVAATRRPRQRRSGISVRPVPVRYGRHRGAVGSTKPLQQRAHVRDRVGIAFQAVSIPFGLPFNLQPDAVRIMEVGGLAIPPLDNFSHGDPMVLEPLVGGVKFLSLSRCLHHHKSGAGGQAWRRPRRRPSTPTAMLALAGKSSGM